MDIEREDEGSRETPGEEMETSKERRRSCVGPIEAPKSRPFDGRIFNADVRITREATTGVRGSVAVDLDGERIEEGEEAGPEFVVRESSWCWPFCEGETYFRSGSDPCGGRPSV